MKHLPSKEVFTVEGSRAKVKIKYFFINKIKISNVKIESCKTTPSAPTIWPALLILKALLTVTLTRYVKIEPKIIEYKWISTAEVRRDSTADNQGPYTEASIFCEGVGKREANKIRTGCIAYGNNGIILTKISICIWMETLSWSDCCSRSLGGGCALRMPEYRTL